MKTKTSRISLILSVVAIMCLSLFLTACGDDHKHSYAASYTSNETHHWFECTGKDCNEKTGYAEHTKEGGICTVCHHGAVAVATNGTNTTYHTTVVDAVDKITTTTPTTITLLTDVTSDGVKVNNNKNIIFDLDGHTYTIDGTMVGSPGTETLGFQLMLGSTVSFKNGTIRQGDNGCKMMIQNYCTLTLEDVILDARNPEGSVTCLYALSNNCGTATIKGDTQIYAVEDKVAFDLYFGMGVNYRTGVAVTFDNSFCGIVEGKIEYGVANASLEVENWEGLTQLEINGNGTFNVGQIAVTNTTTPSIEITGGIYDVDVAQYCAEGYTTQETSNGYRVVETN